MNTSATHSLPHAGSHKIHIPAPVKALFIVMRQQALRLYCWITIHQSETGCRCGRCGFIVPKIYA